MSIAAIIVHIKSFIKRKIDRHPLLQQFGARHKTDYFYRAGTSGCGITIQAL
jgi:hypothetical protein